MSEIKINKELAESKKVIKSTDKKKYKLDDLRKNCLALFNVTISTFDGAVTGLTGEYTVIEIKNIIDKWKMREVKETLI